MGGSTVYSYLIHRVDLSPQLGEHGVLREQRVHN